MPLDFDPVFHTETMVKILREQGSTQYAMELAELILQKDPQHEGVRRILEELREEARRAFERFKSGGRPADAAAETGSAAGEDTEAVSVAAQADDEAAIATDSAVPNSETPLEPAEEFVQDSAFSAETSSAEPVRLTLVPPPPPLSRRAAKIQRLESLLLRVQSLRKAADAPQA